MGWTTYYATHFKGRNIDRAAEARSTIDPQFEVLKERMVGSVYYAAVKDKEQSDVFAAVILTSSKFGCEFGYKSMTEFSMPYYYDCPESILKMLTPTDNATALEWRANCRLKAQKIKAFRQAKQIMFTLDTDCYSHYNKGDTVVLQKNCSGRWIDYKRHIRWASTQILSQNYEIIVGG